MKRLPLLALVLLCGCTDKFQLTDAKRVLGNWVVMDFHSPGATEDRSQRRKKAQVTEETWSQQFMFDQYEDFEYALDPTKSPKQIDLTFTAPNGKRLTVRGIYELPPADSISDRLRVCFGSPPIVEKNGKVEYVESVRPTTFEPTTGALISFRRKTP